MSDSAADTRDAGVQDIERLKLARTSAKRLLTRASTALAKMIQQKSDVATVREKLEVCDQKFAKMKERHMAYHRQLAEMTDKVASEKYFEGVEAGFARLHDEALAYIQSEQQRLQDLLKPHDSVSNASSGSRSSRSSRSSFRCAMLRAQAKSATLKAEAESLQRLQQLQMERMNLEHEEKRVRLEAEIRMAEAEESVFKEQLSDVPDLKCKKSAEGRSDVKAVAPQCQSTPLHERSVFTDPHSQEWQPTHEQDRSMIDLMKLQQRQQQAMVDAFNLPKAELPVYDGDPLKYWQFVRAFDNAVDRANTDPSAKLTRLVQYCTGKAKSVIECCLVMPPEDGYRKARSMLAERFGNSYAISDAWIKRVSEGQPLHPNDATALQDLADNLKSCRETLHAMDLLSEVDTQKSLARIVQRLPIHLQSRWRRQAVSIRRDSGKYPGFEEIVKFVEQAAEEANDPVFGVAKPQASSKVKPVDKAKRGSSSSFGTVVAHADESREPADGQKESNKPRVCVLCGQNHSLFSCEDFKRMKPEERLKLARSKHLCDNCLLPNHVAARCRKPAVCTVCGRKHTRFLHVPAAPSSRSSRTTQGAADPVVDAAEDVSATTCTSGYVDTVHAVKSCHATTALPIVPVNVKSRDGKFSKVTYALLDGGSTNTFCAEELLHDLGMRGAPAALSLTTLERDDIELSTSVVSLEVTGIDEPEVVKLARVFSRPKFPISGVDVPSKADVSKWSHLKDLKLPRRVGAKVELLIGQDVPEALVPRDVRRGKGNEPYAVRSVLGWTLNGPLRLGENHRAVSNFVDAQQLNERLERFWKIDDSNAIMDDVPQMSREDHRALCVMKESLEVVDGHYQTAIPFRHVPVKLPNNREVAVRRLRSLERRLRRDGTLYERYRQGISDLLEKGYAEYVNSDENSQAPVWYLPHHPVTSPSKPGKVRIVFDCSARCGGTSLNDQVLQGPDMTNDLLGVLLRFREGSIAVMGDVEAMYHQVLVAPPDRDVLRFLWWEDDDLERDMIELRMTRHLFGGVWSASTANYALRRTAEDNKRDFGSTTVETVLKSFYVDDCLHSLEAVDEAIILVQELRDLLARGGFNIVKWVSNDRKVMESVPAACRAPTVRFLDFDEQVLPTERALGVKWNVEADNFELSVKMVERPSTRRGVVSVVCSIYDPLGFVAPLLLPAKRVFQELCRLKVNWDDPMPEDVEAEWRQWQAGILRLDKVSVSRCLRPRSFSQITSCELHHFADASQIGYGAVSYLRLVDISGHVHCAFIISKVRLAPLKTMTIPRLELSAAVVAAKLDRKLRKELTLEVDNSYFWTDSMIVLQYLKNTGKRFHTFVANRVAQIHEVSDPAQWRYVRSSDNPADMASRGLTAEEFLNHEEWFAGPAFLYGPEAMWHNPDADVPEVPTDDPEVKKVKAIGKSTTVLVVAEVEKPALDAFMLRYSSWIALKKGIAWFLRMKVILRCKAQMKAIPKFEILLTVAELEEAEEAIVKYVQLCSFADRDSDLLKGLTPVVDSQGVLCVGGRLENAPISHRKKRQMILPKKHHVVNLIIKHFHVVSAHSGLNYVLSLVREKFWIVRARVAIKRVLRDCIPCKKLHARPAQQKMADLPEDRVQPFEPAFTHVGIDCFGPFLIRRGRNVLKRYGCIFTCLVIRAVHIEILHSLDVHSFLNALHRFMARRGEPRLIRSDNGANFTAAERELRKALNEWNESDLPGILAQKGVIWKFNPPASSHMGGAWERQIRSVRKALNSLKDAQVLLDDEGLATLMCLAEAVVNGRPITRQSDDPRDSEALTPNHLLLLKPGSTLPPGVFTKEDVFRRRWRQAQYLANVFWRRWIREYLPTLQLRQKWFRAERNVSTGDIVLVMDENTPCGLWPLGRVIETHPGRDGLVRSVQLKTKSSVLTRPIHKLCLLESVNQ